MFPSEHPYSQRRNAIGIQRTVTMGNLVQQAAELRILGYEVDANRKADELLNTVQQWDRDAD